MPGPLEGVLKQYEARINLHRFEDLAPLISDDAVFWFSEGSFTGPEAIRGAFERTWLIRDETYWLDDLRWVAVGDTAAACTYRFNWTGIVEGQARAGSGRGTTVVRSEAGVWKIVHEHLSGLPAG